MTERVRPAGREVGGRVSSSGVPAARQTLAILGYLASRPGPAGASAPMEAAAILVASGPDEFYMGGGGMRISFTPNTPGPAIVGLGIVQEGKFVDGKWTVVRQLGGDDIGQGEILTLRPNTILRVAVYRYE